VSKPRAYACAICGEPKEGIEPWFLIADNRWQDKLRILQWNDVLAAQPGIYHACAAEHVQELVVHWMTTGSLDYPFAHVPIPGQRKAGKRAPIHDEESAEDADVDTSGARQIGELAVHRESMQRVLSENPHSLTAILEALLSALRRPSVPCKPAMESLDALLVAQEV
jgi:hypothetical protein